MADTTIGGLTPAVSVNSTDLLPLFQAGQTLSATVGQVQSASLGYGFITAQATPSLPQSRAITAGNGISIADSGAGSTLTVALQPNPQLSGVQYLGLPAGTTAERPAGGSFGMVRANVSSNALEWYTATGWTDLATSSGVTAVGLSLPAEFTVSGSPVTSSGTLAGAWASATQNYVFAAPSGSSGTPSFRALVAGDIPSLPYLTSTLASANLLVGNGSNVATAVALSGDATLANTGAITVSSFDGGTDFKSMAGQAADSVAITGGTGTFSSLHAGDVGTEGSGININGVTFQSTFKVSDIDGTNFAQTILHRHSTTLEPLILGARSNIDTTGHASVTNGQNVFSIYGSGSAGSNYKLFGAISVGADATGTISNTSAPGRWTISVTPDGSVNPVTAVTISNSGSVALASATLTLNGAQVATQSYVTGRGYITGNQSITLSGDVSGTGTTGITTTLATVNANVGSFGSASSVATFTADGKGRLTAAGSTAIAIAWSAITSGKPTTVSGYGITNAPTLSGAFSCVFTVTAGTALTLPTSGTLATQSYVTGLGYITGNQSITLSGDVSGTGTTGITTTIGANKVTTGMLAQAAGSTILGNSSTSTANVAALTDAQAATVLARYLELAPRWYS